MYPEDLKYNEEHTWLRLKGSSKGCVGITQFAQEQLKEVVFIELPEIGAEVFQMDPFGVIESVKATNDLYSPVTGVVTAVNEALRDEPGIVNRDPYGDGWMIEVDLSDPGEIASLMAADGYKTLVEG